MIKMDESIEVTSLGNMLSISLFFGEFELGYAYKLYAYKKKSVSLPCDSLLLLIKTQHMWKIII